MKEIQYMLSKKIKEIIGDKQMLCDFNFDNFWKKLIELSNKQVKSHLDYDYYINIYEDYIQKNPKICQTAIRGLKYQVIKRIEKEIQDSASKLYQYRNDNIENYNKKKFKLFVAKKEATEKTSLDKKSLKIEKKICFKRWKEEK